MNTEGKSMSSTLWYFRKALLGGSLIVLLLVYSPWFPLTLGQEQGTGQPGATGAPTAQVDLADKKFDEVMAESDAEAKKKAAEQAAADRPPSLSLLDLFWAGGLLMYPITAMSIIAVAFAVERFFGLRRGRNVPKRLIKGLNSLTTEPGGFDPRRAYKLCQQYPSTAANVIRSMLLKVGRPHSELEHAVSEANDREATRLYSNVRPIALAVTVSPLLGLLGTVQGMIMAFYDTAYAPIGVNKATHLAQGIYVALVTTFAGLTVAIPAAVLVHYFEGRIIKLMRRVDEIAQNLLPHLERYEGKLRVSRQQLSGDSAAPIPSVEPKLQPAKLRGE